MYMFLVHFFVSCTVILGKYLRERLFKLYEKKKQEEPRWDKCTCFGTLDRKDDMLNKTVGLNVFRYFRS
jgi:hypothetical protein